MAQAPAPQPAAPAAAQPPAARANAPAAFTPATPPDKVVITVGDTKITAAQFNELIEMLPEQTRSQARGPGRKQFGDQVVRILTLAEEARRRKIDQNPVFKEQAEFQVDNLLAGRMFGELVQASDAELHQYYDEHKGEFEQIHARHILIRAAGSPVPLDPGQKELTDQEALAKAQDIRKQLLAGADFATLASKESDDSGSKGKGGDLSFFHRGQMIGPFEDAAFKLNVGEISEPVKTPFGYHIIRVEAKNPGTFEEAKPEIMRRVQQQKSQEALQELLKKTGSTMDPAFFGTAPPAPPAAPTGLGVSTPK